MAKKKSSDTAPDAPAAPGGDGSPSADGGAPGPSRPSSGTAAPVVAARYGRPRVRSRDTGAELVSAATGTLRAVHTILPARVPAYLGAAALVVVGVLDPPAALAGGLVYEALRRWTAVSAPPASAD